MITITDGEPTNEPEKKIFQVIRDTKKLCAASPYGPNAVAFQFAQVIPGSRGGREGPFRGPPETEKELLPGRKLRMGFVADRAAAVFSIVTGEPFKQSAELTGEPIKMKA